MKHKQYGFHHVFLPLLIIVLGAIGFVGWKVFNKNSADGGSPSAILKSKEPADQKAIKAGKFISGGKCEGTGKLTFTHLPMREQDFNVLIPYGLVVGGHVTPIDHQYFAPRDYKSARDTYPVYAMADATITDIQPRTNERGTEYRFVFAHSCTSLYYYDLVTSLTGKVKEAYDKNRRDINLPIKAGEQVGAIGGQTLDFAVWNTEKPLTGFINPASYDGEGWKIYTDDPYPYYTPQLRALLIERNPRTVEPIAGKIDYDIDGKLIGNWFEKGTGGYRSESNKKMEYWGGHLSIAPNHYDPSAFVISLGDFAGEAAQFAAQGNSPDPASVGVDTGLVKYSLQKFGYNKPDGTPWDNMSIIKNPKLRANGPIEGCLLVQLTDKRLLKAESFPKKNCSAIAGFTASAKTYER
jgi:hypothetical protein